jgi:hypothetical protein
MESRKTGRSMTSIPAYQHCTVGTKVPGRLRTVCRNRKAARQLSRCAPLAPHHTCTVLYTHTSPTHTHHTSSQICQGADLADSNSPLDPCRPPSRGSGAHLRTSSVSRQNFHACMAASTRHPGQAPRLPRASAPNHRTESSQVPNPNPCRPRGSLPNKGRKEKGTLPHPQLTSPPIRIPPIAKPVLIPIRNSALSAKGGEP